MPSTGSTLLRNDFSGRAVLVSGGTRGIGLATGLAFGRLGAHVILTHRWGSADEDAIRGRFADASAPPPVIAEADASRPEENRALVEDVCRRGLAIDVFVACVCVVARGRGLEGLTLRTTRQSLAYNVRPFAEIMEIVYECSGRYPRYSIALSSDGHRSWYPGYDHVAASKAVLESTVATVGRRLHGQDARANVVRTRHVRTEGYREIFSDADRALLSPFAGFALEPEDVADGILGLCSGYLDAVNGEVLVLDRGAGLVDNVLAMGPRLLERGVD